MLNLGWGNSVSKLVISWVKNIGQKSFPKTFPAFSQTLSPTKSIQTTSINFLFLPIFHSPNNNKFYINNIFTINRVEKERTL